MVIESRVAIVTGAASGMGEALAKDLHAQGWIVACVDLNRQAGESLAKSLGGNARFFYADVADYDSQSAMFAHVWQTWGRIDALCANAGIVDRSSVYILSHRGNRVSDIPPAPDLSCTDIDYKGVVYGTQLAVHFMRHNKVPGGKIVCTASIAGVFPHQSYPEYSGAKAAVVNFVRCVAPVLKIKENITVNAVLPGIVQTSIIPKELVDAVRPDCVTPISTIVAGYNRFLKDDTLNGQILEGSADKLLAYGLPEPMNGHATVRAYTVWDPLFKMLHNENSGLPNALP
ncbi:hypothetical protein AJ80_04060 [Polytolypa hystricis UAMH7299]|uniref:15-hydroxyprostaglandin dehydrogenase (NAD(+)) n=1 Tax=Polytolypa hystricis (strain UAMH7299) TaxID=1447883 RepID=A0A2B7YFC6_POLH7|nr:hypothetical protein AJ80_04060 [Polytolypa hystricis UAMH7299]